MKELRYTLISDGSSDCVLMPLLTWLLRQHVGPLAIQEAWADFRHLLKPPTNLADRIVKSLDLYPCHLLFVHRDAEGEPPDKRYEEINRALDVAKPELASDLPAVCVVPVRMQEAWFLFDEIAIRAAARGPACGAPLDLPKIDSLESLPDPKKKLHRALLEASNLSGRRREKFQSKIPRIVHEVPRAITDFSPLRKLSAFRNLETDIEAIVELHGWKKSEVS